MSIKLMSLAILKGPETSLDEVQNYLSEAGATVFCSDSAVDVVKHSTVKVPDFVLISAEQPEEQMMKVKTLVEGVLKVPTIGFSQTQGDGCLFLLGKLKFKHVIKGKPTGPRIEKAILDILDPSGAKSAHIDIESEPFFQAPSGDAPIKEIEAKETVLIKNREEDNNSWTMFGCIREAITDLNKAGKTNKNGKMSLEVSESKVFEFRFGRIYYYFVLAALDNAHVTPTDAMAFRDMFYQKTAPKINCEPTLDPVPVSFPKLKMKEWLQQEGFVSAMVDLKGQFCIAGVIINPGARIEVKATEAPDFFEVPAATIPMDQPLPFNIYVFLEITKKHFLLVERGRVFDNEKMNKLSVNAVRSVFINKKELHAFWSACITKSLAPTYSLFLSK